LKWREQDEGTRHFREQVPKKIVPVNLYNPHAEPEGEKNKRPEPTTYKIQRLFDHPYHGENDEIEPRLNLVQGGKVYAESNIDRFGLPIRPLKPLNMVPGPGDYHQGEMDGMSPQVAKGGFISDAPAARALPLTTQKGIPGPSYYNGGKEPKKISFLFNPAEKWVQ